MATARGWRPIIWFGPLLGFVGLFFLSHRDASEAIDRCSTNETSQPLDASKDARAASGAKSIDTSSVRSMSVQAARTRDEPEPVVVVRRWLRALADRDLREFVVHLSRRARSRFVEAGLVETFESLRTQVDAMILRGKSPSEVTLAYRGDDQQGTLFVLHDDTVVITTQMIREDGCWRLR